MKFFSWSSSKLTYSSQYSEKGDRISKNSGIFEQALKLTFLGEGKKLHAINSDSLFFSSCVLCMFYYFFFMINWNVIFFKRAGFSFCWNPFRKVSNELRSRTLFTFEFLHFVKRKGKIWELGRWGQLKQPPPSFLWHLLGNHCFQDDTDRFVGSQV